MTNLYKKIGVLFFLFYVVSLVTAQPLSYKTISHELQSIQKQLVPDKRVAILDIEFKDTLQSTVVVFGETDLPHAKKQIIKILNDNKVSFVDSIRVLPDASLGDKIWALTTLSVSNLRANPSDASELVSQTVMGTPLKILDYRNKWYRVQTPDYYIGWMDSGSLKPFTEKEMEQWKTSDRYLFNRISGLAYDAPNVKSNIVSDLVLDNLFEVETSIKGFLKIRTPDGRSGYIQKSECISFDKWIHQQPNAQSILLVARQMMGFPYLWGGTSTKGIDCSGFVKIAYYSQGIILARDASQQARYVEPIDFNDTGNLQAGDLLFFGRSAQRITHVGIYLGKSDFIHASGRVHISSIDPNDSKYVPERHLVAAGRILNSIGTEGIVRVKDHPWYTVQP